MWTGEAPSTCTCHDHDRTMRRTWLARPVFPLEGGATIERHFPAPEPGRKKSAPGGRGCDRFAVMPIRSSMK